MSVASRLARGIPFYYGWVILGAAGSSQFARNAAASLTLAVFVYPISEDLGWSRTVIAGAASIGGLAASAASPAVGWFADRYGVRLLLTISVLVLGLSTISIAWATVPIAFYLAYGMGRVLFSSPIHIGSTVVVSRWFVRQRGKANGILSLCHSGGMVLFPLLAAFAIQLRGDWRDAWVFLGLLVWLLALGPVSLLIVQSPEDLGLRPDGDRAATGPDQRSQAAAEPEWTTRQAVSTPALWMLASSTCMLFVMQAGTNVHQAAYFMDRGLGATIAATSIAINGASLGIGGLAWGWLADRVSVRYVFAGVAALMGGASALFITADTTIEALVYPALFGLSLGGILVIPPVAYANYFGRRSLGAVRGITEPFASLGQAIGAVISGAVFDITGSYASAFAAFAVMGGLTTVVLLLTRPPTHSTQPKVA